MSYALTAGEISGTLQGMTCGSLLVVLVLVAMACVVPFWATYAVLSLAA